MNDNTNVTGMGGSHWSAKHHRQRKWCALLPCCRSFFAFAILFPRTLLVVDVAYTGFYHFDTMSHSSGGGVVSSMAKKFASKMLQCVEKFSRNDADTSANAVAAASSSAVASSAPSSQPSTRSNKNLLIAAPLSCPHQTNGSDCGVYALAIAESIAHVRSKRLGVSIGGEEVAAALKATTPKEITKKRQEIQATIQKIAAESKK